MTRALTVGSVCSGIGAPEVAWRDLGWRYLWSADIDDFANAVRATHFPAVPNLGDMTLIAERIAAGEIEAPDIMVGGTPCQSFSLAGLRRGLRDQRGNLALEFIRIADAIDVVRRAADLEPAFILWENVPGILSDRGNALGTFLAGMVGSDSPLVSRGRWTYAGVVDGPSRCAAWRVLDAQHFGLAQRRERIFVLARGGAGRWAAADALLPIIESVQWNPAPRRSQEEALARPIAAGSRGSGGQRFDADTAENFVLAFGGNNTSGAIDLAPSLLAQPGSGWKGDFESETFVAHGFDATPLDCFLPLAAGAHSPAIAGMAVRRLTPREAERLQGFPDDYTLISMPRAAQKRVEADFAAYIRRRMPDIADEAIRRLAADGPRYRALGNSMAVPVIEWIGRRIAHVHDLEVAA